jgi:hypothetical protein
VIIIASEKLFENKVKKFLKDEGCWFLKYWAGASYTKSGIPDLIICCNSYFLGVELKAPNGKPSELQLWNIEKIIEAGGIGIVLYPRDFIDFKILIKDLKDKPKKIQLSSMYGELKGR